jgi:hypothetical protein
VQSPLTTHPLALTCGTWTVEAITRGLSEVYLSEVHPHRDSLGRLLPAVLCAAKSGRAEPRPGTGNGCQFRLTDENI